MGSEAGTGITEETINALVDGELGAEESRWFARVVACNPQLSGRVFAYRAQLEALHKLYDGVADEPIPTRLIALLR